MDLYGYCPECGAPTGDMHDNELCDNCKKKKEQVS